MKYKEVINRHFKTKEFPEFIEVWAIIELSQWDLIDLYEALSYINYEKIKYLYNEIWETLKKSNI